MPSIVDFPTLVKEALDVFGDLFDNEPARQHFAEYLTGLMVDQSGICHYHGSVVFESLADGSSLGRKDTQ